MAIAVSGLLGILEEHPMRSHLGWFGAVLLAVALVGSGLTPDILPARVAAPRLTTAPPVATLERPIPVRPGSVRSVVERVRPAVVQITNEQLALDQFGRPAITPAGVGSGVIYDSNGLILTNNHVIADARSLTVSLPDGRTYRGRLLGGDTQMDLAVVKIDLRAGDSLPVAALGDSAALAVGDEVVAIGNALGLPGGPTVTAGVVSALDRALQEPGDIAGEPGPYLYDLIQTDAAINPGNSGGPLLNMSGEVIGINTLAASGDGNVAAQGIGFAIAINAVRPIADQLVSEGRVTHPFIGIAYTFVTPALAKQFDLPATRGVVITSVVRRGPAALAGLQPKDVITAVDNEPVVDETSLGRALTQRKPGEQIQLAVARGNERLALDVTLGARAER
jgi:serine protease Do